MRANRPGLIVESRAHFGPRNPCEIYRLQQHVRLSLDLDQGRAAGTA
jgi:hypothetical protein